VCQQSNKKCLCYDGVTLYLYIIIFYWYFLLTFLWFNLWFRENMFYVSLFLNYSSRRKLLRNYYHLNKNVCRANLITWSDELLFLNIYWRSILRFSDFVANWNKSQFVKFSWFKYVAIISIVTMRDLSRSTIYMFVSRNICENVQEIYYDIQRISCWRTVRVSRFLDTRDEMNARKTK